MKVYKYVYTAIIQITLDINKIILHKGIYSRNKTDEKYTWQLGFCSTQPGSESALLCSIHYWGRQTNLCPGRRLSWFSDKDPSLFLTWLTSSLLIFDYPFTIGVYDHGYSYWVVSCRRCTDYWSRLSAYSFQVFLGGTASTAAIPSINHSALVGGLSAPALVSSIIWFHSMVLVPCLKPLSSAKENTKSCQRPQGGNAGIWCSSQKGYHCQRSPLLSTGICSIGPVNWGVQRHSSDKHSAEEHIKRSNLQAYIWKQCILKDINYPNPAECGWLVEENSLVPVWFHCS